MWFVKVFKKYIYIFTLFASINLMLFGTAGALLLIFEGCAEVISVCGFISFFILNYRLLSSPSFAFKWVSLVLGL